MQRIDSITKKKQDKRNDFMEWKTVIKKYHEDFLTTLNIYRYRIVYNILLAFASCLLIEVLNE